VLLTKVSHLLEVSTELFISLDAVILRSEMRDVYKCKRCGKYLEEPAHCGTRAEHLMSGKDRLALSKLISYILRHNPSAAGLKVSSNGWVRISDLVRAIKEVWVNKEKYKWVTEEHVRALAALDPKGRFEVKGDLIRARYGHSKRLGLKVTIDYDVDAESKVLYHGTTVTYLPSILKEGIKPMRRQYVHLTTDKDIACETGARHGKPVVLAVDAECLRKLGITVFKASNVIRLVEYVPSECIKKYFSC